MDTHNSAATPETTTAPARRVWETPVITLIDVAESTEAGAFYIGLETGYYSS